MVDNQPVDGDEIDLFDVIEMLWDGRVILAGFIVSAMALCAVFLALNKPEYVTKIKYEIKPIPIIEKDEIQTDISRAFFNSDTFALWKKGQPSTLLNVNLIDQRKIIDGASFATKEEARLVYFGENQIEIKSNDVELIFEILDYFNFVSSILSNKYLAEARGAYSRVVKIERQLFAKLSSNDALRVLEEMSKLDRYLESASEENSLVLISRPLPPENIGISRSISLTLAIILGGASGAVFLLVRLAYRARKLRLAVLEA